MYRPYMGSIHLYSTWREFDPGTPYVVCITVSLGFPYMVSVSLGFPMKNTVNIRNVTENSNLIIKCEWDGGDIVVTVTPFRHHCISTFAFVIVTSTITIMTTYIRLQTTFKTILEFTMSTVYGCIYILDGSPHISLLQNNNVLTL